MKQKINYWRTFDNFNTLEAVLKYKITELLDEINAVSSNDILVNVLENKTKSTEISGFEEEFVLELEPELKPDPILFPLFPFILYIYYKRKCDKGLSVILNTKTTIFCTILH